MNRAETLEWLSRCIETVAHSALLMDIGSWGS